MKAKSQNTNIIRTVSVPVSRQAKVQIEALQTLLQIPAARILECALQALLGSLPTKDQQLVTELVDRSLDAHQNVNPRSSASENAEPKEANTVTGKIFKYLGSLSDGLTIVFDNSNPMEISAEKIALIKAEIARRKGPVLMGAIYSPLMPNSLGEAISKRHGITPITLSYVVPLLQQARFCRTWKKGRAWVIETVKS